MIPCHARCRSSLGIWRWRLAAALVVVLISGCGGPSRAELQALRSGPLTERDWERLDELLSAADSGRYAPGRYAEVLETLARRVSARPDLAQRFVGHCTRIVDRPQVWESWTEDGRPLVQLLDYQRGWALQAWWHSSLQGADAAMIGLLDRRDTGLHTGLAALTLAYRLAPQLAAGDERADAVYQRLPAYADHLTQIPASALLFGPSDEAGAAQIGPAVAPQQLVTAVRARYRNPTTVTRALAAANGDRRLIRWCLADAAQLLAAGGDDDAMLLALCRLALDASDHASADTALALIFPDHPQRLAKAASAGPLDRRGLGIALAVLPQAQAAEADLRQRIAQDLATALGRVEPAAASELLAGFAQHHPRLLIAAVSRLDAGAWQALPAASAEAVLAVLRQVGVESPPTADLAAAERAVIAALPGIAARTDAAPLLADLVGLLPPIRHPDLQRFLVEHLDHPRPGTGAVSLAAWWCARGDAPDVERLTGALGRVLLVEDDQRAAVAAVGLAGAGETLAQVFEAMWSQAIDDPALLERAVQRYLAYHAHLGPQGDQRLIERLFQTLDHPDPAVSRNAVTGLSRLIPSDATDQRERFEQALTQRWPLVEPQP